MTGFGKWIHTKRFDSSIKSQILSTSYSNRKLEIIGIGFVYTYPCFFAGGIRSYSQSYGKSVLQTLCYWNLGFQGKIIVYAGIQPHRIANYIAACIPALQKSRTGSLHNTFTLVLADDRWTIYCCDHCS